MQKYIISIIVAIVFFSFFYLKYTYDKLNEEIRSQELVISSLVTGYNKAIEVMEEESKVKVEKAKVVSSTKLKEVIKDRGEINEANNNEYFIATF
jgi:hypothetical protein